MQEAHAGFFQNAPVTEGELPERYRSGRNGVDSKSTCPVKSGARGFESHPLRQKAKTGLKGQRFTGPFMTLCCNSSIDLYNCDAARGAECLFPLTGLFIELLPSFFDGQWTEIPIELFRSLRRMQGTRGCRNGACLKYVPVKIS